MATKYFPAELKEKYRGNVSHQNTIHMFHVADDSTTFSSNIIAAVKSEMFKIKVQPRFCLALVTTILIFVLPILFSFLPSEW